MRHRLKYVARYADDTVVIECTVKEMTLRMTVLTDTSIERVS